MRPERMHGHRSLPQRGSGVVPGGGKIWGRQVPGPKEEGAHGSGGRQTRAGFQFGVKKGVSEWAVVVAGQH